MDKDDQNNSSQNDAQDADTARVVPLGGDVDIELPAKEENDVDDVEIESYNDDGFSGGSMTPQDHIKRLREKLRECTKEKTANLDGWQRAKADFVNYKKREEESKSEFLKFAREELVVDLLPVLESFHMAFANKEAWEKVDPAWRKGMEFIHTQLVQVLGDHGLVEVNPLGKKFDPMEATSMGVIETGDKEKYHTVALVLQPGYRLNGKLVRSPKVKIYGEPARPELGTGGKATDATSQMGAGYN